MEPSSSCEWFCFGFFMSFQVTTFETTIIRSAMGFFAFFFLTFFFRWIWSFIYKEPGEKGGVLAEGKVSCPHASENSADPDIEKTTEMVRHLLKDDD
ncbi:hypothetical protein SAMN04487936_11064 [Halobacillus dabanensis]|uniref:Uncharacterized protein n=1 Tax=Halobacillus dabanensis TaxID=240302 RepID=A0A1I3Y6E1_HALDA|nr:hypothetical protein [Halobacillus dabanensis]SFK27333.1 hypothetical protein SAMN04487936_11064 [Halobacillus dabanensis]